MLNAFAQYHRGPVAEQGSKYQKFSWADKFGTGLVTIADIADAALHNKHYDAYWAHPLYSSSPATCSATGGPGTGTLQCVDIGDISTIALYKGIGATDPIPLSSYVGLDPRFNHFNPGVAAPAGCVFLAMTPSGSTVQVQTAEGSTVTCSGASSFSLEITPPGGASTVFSGTITPTANGRTVFNFNVGALAPGTEVEFVCTVSNGITIYVELHL